jgi:hypothetical protein
MKINLVACKYVLAGLGRDLAVPDGNATAMQNR